jgi:hypothetical protein
MKKEQYGTKLKEGRTVQDKWMRKEEVILVAIKLI